MTREINTYLVEKENERKSFEKDVTRLLKKARTQKGSPNVHTFDLIALYVVLGTLGAFLAIVIATAIQLR
jgi:hypothetical protein